MPELSFPYPMQCYLERLTRLIELYAKKKGQFRLSSGRVSNVYIDTKKVTLTAEGHFLVGQIFNEVIRRKAPRAPLVGGIDMGSVPIASAVSQASFATGDPIDSFVIRKESKEHGSGNRVETGLPRRHREGLAVVVEDVVTTGRSTIDAVKATREAGISVGHVIALVDRDEGGGEAIQSEAGCNYTAIIGMDELLV